MTESNKKNTENQKTTKFSTKGKDSKPSRSYRLLLFSLPLIITIFTAATLSYYIQTKNEKQFSYIIPTLKMLKTELDDQKKHDELITGKIAANHGQFDYLLKKIESTDEHLRHIDGSDRKFWVLSEIDYLLRLANQRLLTIKDIRVAIRLLYEVENLIQKLDDQSLLGIRHSLKNDTMKLKSYEHVDIEGIWLRLNVLITKTASLSTLPDAGFTVAELKKNSVSALENKTWTEKIIPTLWKGWHVFKDQFRLRTDHNQAFDVLPAAKEEIYLKLALRMMLEQAQIALLQGHAKIYMTSLDNTKKWLQDWFSVSGNETLAVYQELGSLRQMSILEEAPNLNNTIKMLRAYIDSNNSRQ